MLFLWVFQKMQSYGLQRQIAVYNYSTERCNPTGLLRDVGLYRFYREMQSYGLQRQIAVYHYSTERCNPNGLPFYLFKIIITLPHKKS